MATLWIIVLATSLSHPQQYQTLRVGMVYETRHVCEAAQKRVYGDIISEWATKALHTEARHVTIREVTTTCRMNNPNI